MDDIAIIDSILTNQPTFSGYSPKAETLANGTTLITTYSLLTYDLDPLDFNNHLSAKTMKAKMKLADAIYKLIGLPQRGNILPCSEINK